MHVPYSISSSPLYSNRPPGVCVIHTHTAENTLNTNNGGVGICFVCVCVFATSVCLCTTEREGGEWGRNVLRLK